jgi:hypothetical protein
MLTHTAFWWRVMGLELLLGRVAFEVENPRSLMFRVTQNFRPRTSAFQASVVDLAIFVSIHEAYPVCPYERQK